MSTVPGMPPKKTQKPAATPAAAEPVQTNLRVPGALLERLDEWVEKLNGQSHARWTRNAVVLALIERGLRERGEKGEAP